MERLIEKIYLESNSIFGLYNINKIKNIEINLDPDTNKKLFIYKDYGIQIKNDVAYRIVFFKIDSKDINNIQKLCEIENVKIKSPNKLVIMFKYNEIWNAKLYCDVSLSMLKYFCKKFKIQCLIDDYGKNSE
jgi:hypothetical protein